MSIWQTRILIILPFQLNTGNWNYHVKDTAAVGQNEPNGAASNLLLKQMQRVGGYT